MRRDALISSRAIRYVAQERALLIDAASRIDRVLPRDEAIDVIIDVERFSEVDAEDAIAQLESRGDIYIIEEQICITPTDE